MANDDWKYKELPKAAGETAPAVWNPKENKWEVYTGSTNVVELENKLETIEEHQKQILERLDGEFDTRLTGSNVEYPNDYPDANAGERLEAIEQTQESIINALQTTNENLNNVIDDDSLLTNSKPAKTFSFLTKVSPKTQKIIKESEIGDEINFGDLRQFKAFYFGVDSGPISGETSSHGFRS